MYDNPYIPNYPNPYFTGYNMPHFNGNMQPNMFNQQTPTAPQNGAQIAKNTNKYYVCGMDGARGYQLPKNSEIILCDDSSSIIYDVIVDAEGKRTVTAYDIVAHQEEPPIDYSTFATKDDLKTLKDELMKMHTAPSAPTVSKPVTAKI